MIVKLSKTYKSREGKPVLREIDTDIFSIKCYSSCMSCHLCKDDCCKEGAIADVENVKKILKNEEFLKDKVDINPKYFFKEVFRDEDFPSGKGTFIPEKNGSCIFINKKGRGCRLHTLLVSQHRDYHELKPIICCLFPVSFEKGELCPAPEFNNKNFICLEGGSSLYDASRNELKYYFGEDFVRELDKIRDSTIKR